MARRRKVALFADGGFLAHTTRVLEVGRALRRAYNHATYFEERQVMMQDWADHLAQWRAAAHERP